nr:sodium-dependent phosphate transport protein 1, chloroplastic-like [Tanacetum cinerariifolium]
MAGKSLPITLYSRPKRHRPPDTSVHHKKLICMDSNNSYYLNLKAKKKVGFEFLSSYSNVSVMLRGARFDKYEVWRIRSDVKSESYEVSKSTGVPGSFKFKERLGGAGDVGDSGDEFDDESGVPWWEEFPKRWTIVILCFSAFLLCNMDRVNMSIAILPMSSEYHWNSTTVGLIQSSFFWGYLLTQIAGGIWADTVGGKRVLAFGVIWWSVATVLTPIAAKLGLPFLLIVRAFMGVGEGVAMPAMNNLLSKWVPVAERSRSLALVYSGMYLGSVTGLAFSPFLIHSYGWPSVFFSFGSLGTVWAALWLNKAYSSPLEDPELRPEEKKVIFRNRVSEEPVKDIPWGQILSKAPVWALISCHFCHNWGTFILLTWMPTYYNQVLGFNLTESGLFCVLPWLTMAFSANLGGWIADTLVSKGWSVTTVRKVMQSIGFLGPAFFLSQLSHIDSPAMAVFCMACSQGSDAFSQSGLYSNHQDIAPRYSGVLLGLSNTAGVLAGVFGTAATGYILQHGSWDEVFDVAIGLYLVGTVIWNLFSTGEKIID